MFTFILVSILLLALFGAVIAMGIAIGGGFLAVFGDILVFILIILAIIKIAKKLFNKD